MTTYQQRITSLIAALALERDAEHEPRSSEETESGWQTIELLVDKTRHAAYSLADSRRRTDA